MKKIILIILTLLLCLSLVACGDDGVPEGMQDATTEGQPFKLYVPSSWTENTSSGTSGASVRIADDKVIVSARVFAEIFCADTTLNEFPNTTIASCQKTFGESFNLISQSSTVLAGKDAIKLVYDFETDDKYTATAYYTLHESYVILLSFYTTGNAHELFADNISDIVTNFTLCEKSLVSEDAVIDKNTPEGMKIASSDKLEYRFYVPMTWVCSSESGMSEAYFPEGKTNVTVTSYSPDKAMTLKEYFELCESEYAKNLTDYVHLSTLEGANVAGLDAYDFIFSSNNDSFRTRQVVFYSPVTGLFYNITYTATTGNYKLHIDDFEAMLDAFTFR